MSQESLLGHKYGIK